MNEEEDKLLNKANMIYKFTKPEVDVDFAAAQLKDNQTIAFFRDHTNKLFTVPMISDVPLTDLHKLNADNQKYILPNQPSCTDEQNKCRHDWRYVDKQTRSGDEICDMEKICFKCRLVDHERSS